MTPVADILNRAAAAKQDGRCDDAMVLLEPLLAAEFPPTGALVLASECARLLDAGPGGYGRAQAYLQRALDLDPMSIDATLELAHLLHTVQDEPTPALKQMIERAAFLLDQADISLTLLRAGLLKDERDWRGMHALIAPAAARHPSSEILAERLAWLNKKLGIP